jgi:hypothetical protein
LKSAHLVTSARQSHVRRSMSWQGADGEGRAALLSQSAAPNDAGEKWVHEAGGEAAQGLRPKTQVRHERDDYLKVTDNGAAFCA